MRLFTLDKLRKIGDGFQGGWPGHLFGGRIRTSTVVLMVAFAVLWWIYDDHQHSVESSKPAQVPATQVVPPGFVPDPNYTWVPRTRLQQPPVTVTETPPPTTIPSTTRTEPSTPTTTTEPPPPPFGLPPIVLPPPFGPPATTTPPPFPGQEPEPPAAPPPPGQLPEPARP